MFGKLLNTLSYRVDSELRRWRRNNPTVREYAWPWYQRIWIALGKHAAQTSRRLFWIFILLLGVVWAYQEFLGTVNSNSIPQKYELKQYLFTLWTIQATIAAVVYPIVIGFVTLLLQRRHSAKDSLQIYLHDSAAIFTGLSALFLVLFISIQFLLITVSASSIFVIGNTVLFSWLILDGVWFLLNMCGVIWFIYRTFKYLDSEQRMKTVRAYAINYVWFAEICNNLKEALFHEAVSHGWLHKLHHKDKPSDSRVVIQIGSHYRDKGEVPVTKHKKDGWFIGNVRFRFLSWAILSWQWRIDKCPPARPNELGPPAISYSPQPLFILPSVPSQPFKAEDGLCRIVSEVDLVWWERWLVRRAFVFEKNPRTASISAREILNGLIAEARVAMEAGEEVAFGEVLHELVELHTELIRAGSFVTDENEHDSYTVLESGDGILFPCQLHKFWLREYYRLMEAAAYRISVSSTYFAVLAYVPGKLVRKLVEMRPTAIPCGCIDLSKVLHDYLNHWWSRAVEEQGVYNHNPCEPATLKAPIFTSYETAIEKFAGAWESLRGIELQPKSEMSWKQYGEIGELHVRHLDNTLYMLFGSLSLGNESGAKWLCDSLIKWGNKDCIRVAHDYVEGYAHDNHKLTLELTKKVWEEAEKTGNFSALNLNERDMPKALWAVCVYNYWVDLCCISLYAMIQLGKACGCEKSLLPQLIGNLGTGEPLRSNGGLVSSGRRPIKNAEDLLIAIIRQHHFDVQGYRFRLSDVIRNMAAQSQSAAEVCGSYDLDTFGEGQLVLLCLLAKKDWLPSVQFISNIKEWGTKDNGGLKAFVDKLTWWEERLNNDKDNTENEFVQEYKDLFSCVREQFVGEEGEDAMGFEDAVEVLKGVVNQLRGCIEKTPE